MLKEFLSVFNREAEKRKLTFHGNSCKEEKNVSSITRIFRFELPLKKLSWLDEYQPEKNYILRKKKQFKFARCWIPPIKHLHFQHSAYEKQGRATIARLVTKFRGYGVWKVPRHPPSRRVVACDDYCFQNTTVFVLLHWEIPNIIK